MGAAIGWNRSCDGSDGTSEDGVGGELIVLVDKRRIRMALIDERRTKAVAMMARGGE